MSHLILTLPIPSGRKADTRNPRTHTRCVPLAWMLCLCASVSGVCCDVLVSMCLCTLCRFHLLYVGPMPAHTFIYRAVERAHIRSLQQRRADPVYPCYVLNLYAPCTYISNCSHCYYNIKHFILCSCITFRPPRKNRLNRLALVYIIFHSMHGISLFYIDGGCVCVCVCARDGSYATVCVCIHGISSVSHAAEPK